MSEHVYKIVGGRSLSGTVTLSGSKNGALPTLAATLLVEGETILENVPRISDVHTMLELLRSLGLVVKGAGGGTVRVINRGLRAGRPAEEPVREMRASHYVLGPVALRTGRAELPIPGGCQLGSRPVEHFLSVLRALGAEAQADEARIVLRCDGFRGARVTLDPQHRNPGATFTALMAAAVAEGESVIEHASYEPDVVHFCRFLARCGADLRGVGTSTLVVRGVRKLTGTRHRVNCDRLEAGTFICAAAATRGEVMVEGVTREELGESADRFEEAGIALAEGARGLTARTAARPRAVEVTTGPFPEFSTDLQPIFAAVLAAAEGISTVRETVFDNRLRYAPELARMGAKVDLRGPRHLVIEGVERLRGARVEGHNIRDAAALVVAALSADGESEVEVGPYLGRGYEDLAGKLRLLGAEITAG